MGRQPKNRPWQTATLLDFADRFPTEKAAEDFIVESRWPDGVRCPRCSGDRVYEPGGTAPMRFRCRPCRRFFSAKSGTSIAHSNLSYRRWLFIFFLMRTRVTGLSSLELSRDVGTSPKSGWHTGHRVREGMGNRTALLEGTIEVDETYLGGKERPKHRRNRLVQKDQIWRGKGNKGKVIVVAALCRETGEVRAEVVTRTNRHQLAGFIRRHVKPGSTVYTDSHGAYAKLHEYDHKIVNHRKGEYVRGDVHTNGIESFWARVKRAHKGVYYYISPKHAERYVREFVTRNNHRMEDTLEGMRAIIRGMVGKRLTLKDLMADD